MSVAVIDLVVHHEDGTTVPVRVDQRDFAMWEVEPFGRPFEASLRTCMHLFMRWCAWHALTRRGETQEPWTDWNGRVVEVEPADEPAAPDPGTPTADDES